jgi:hypothetical protein
MGWLADEDAAVPSMPCIRDHITIHTNIARHGSSPLVTPREFFVAPYTKVFDNATHLRKVVSFYCKPICYCVTN